jgi:hypothetical protein
MQFLHNISKTLSDVTAGQEQARTKANLNHKDHEEFEGPHLFIFLNLCELRVLRGHKYYAKKLSLRTNCKTCRFGACPL